MKLEDQVCSLELSRRLKELGVKQDSYWFWSMGFVGFNGSEWMLVMNKPKGQIEHFAAFTAAELGEMLPFDCPTYHWQDSDGDTSWFGQIRNDQIEMNDEEGEISARTEADARGKMLIHLLENNLITTAESNSRLKGKP